MLCNPVIIYLTMVKARMQIKSNLVAGSYYKTFLQIYHLIGYSQQQLLQPSFPEVI